MEKNTLAREIQSEIHDVAFPVQKRVNFPVLSNLVMETPDRAVYTDIYT